ncbi:MAG: ComEC/Rec2 family competence protein [Ruminococcus sp.]|nr:ComEC/Rec2 family competence protein [Ruminococcus sp.]
MKRKTIGAAAAYMSGSFFASFLLGINGLVITAIAAVMLFVLRKRIGLDRYDAVLITVFFAAAVCMRLGYEHFVISPQQAFIGRECTFAGTVEDIDRYTGDTASYVLRGAVVSDGMEPVNARITYYGADTGASVGDTIRIGSCMITAPEDTYLYSTRNYSFSQHIFLEAKRVKDTELIGRDGFVLKRAIASYRERMISDFRIALGENSGSFLAGIVFGEKGTLDRSAKTVLYRTGIGHLLAVSGLHVSILAGMILLLLRKLRAGRVLSFTVLNIFMILLILMAGSPVSAIRAALMLDLVVLAKLFRRRSDPLNGLAIASLLISITDPCAIYSAGFLLSLAGTFGIAVLAPFMLKGHTADTPVRKAGMILLTGFFTTLSVFPLSLWFFDETSIISPVTNIAAVPVCAAAMVTGLLYAISGGYVNFLWIAGILLDGMISASQRIASVPGVYVNRSGYEVCAVVFAFGITAVIMYLAFRSRRITAVLISAAMVSAAAVSVVVNRSRYNTLTAAVLGENGRAAIVVTYRGRADVIDLSGYYSDPRYVRKYLSVNGISSVDTVILTDKVQSLYSAYAEELALCDIGTWIISGDAPVSEEDKAVMLTEGEAEIDTESLHYSLSDGILTVSLPDGKRLMTVHRYDTPCDTADGAEIIYGSRSAGYIPAMPDISNFELVFSSDDEYYIRRL